MIRRHSDTVETTLGKGDQVSPGFRKERLRDKAEKAARIPLKQTRYDERESSYQYQRASGITTIIAGVSLNIRQAAEGF